MKTKRYHYITVRMAKIQNMKTPNAGKDVKQNKPLFTADRNARWQKQLRI